MNRTLAVGLFLGQVAFFTGIPVRGQYDPLQIEAARSVQIKDFTITDAERSREIPLRVYLPENKGASPVVVFSHGLGGSRANSSFLGNHWSARGYLVVFVQHPGSDESVWRDVALTNRMLAMQQAANPVQLVARCLDVHRVLNELQSWNQSEEHELKGRFNMDQMAMTGHSFGAHTTQALCGQSFPLVGGRYVDPRFKCAIAFSPSAPLRGSVQSAFEDVKIPWLLMTGTEDTSPIGGQTVASRRSVYPALPQSNPKFELVLFQAEHSAFSDRPIPGESGKRNPNHHRVILAVSTAFLDAYLLAREDAKTWMVTEQIHSVLEADDRWQFHVPK